MTSSYDSDRATLNTQRRAIARLLAESPSLRPRRPELMDAGYADGLDLAVAETPFDYDQLPPH